MYLILILQVDISFLIIFVDGDFKKWTQFVTISHLTEHT